MAHLYKRVGGRAFEQAIALNDGVQAELEARAFEIGIRAEQLLVAHRQEGHAEIVIEEGDVDKHVVLSDERGQKAAMSIEYGRAPGEIEVTDPDTGERYMVETEGMEGLFILHRAANLPKKRKGRVKM